MLRILLLVFLAFTVPFTASGQHAGIFISQEDALAIREAQGRYALLDEAISLAKETMAVAFAHPLEVPLPGEAGGYEHERHKGCSDLHRRSLRILRHTDVKCTLP